MGLGPEQVDNLSMWQYAAAIHGYNRNQRPEKEKEQELSHDELEDLYEFIGI